MRKLALALMLLTFGATVTGCVERERVIYVDDDNDDDDRWERDDD